MTSAELLTIGLVAHSTPFIFKKISQYLGKDTKRSITEKRKICIVSHTKSGKTTLVNNLDSNKYVLIDLDDLSSYVECDEVKKLEDLKQHNKSLYDLLYKDVVKGALAKVKKQLGKKKLLCFCSSYELASYLFKESSVYCAIASQSFRNVIRDGLNTEKDRKDFNQSVEDLLQHLHKNRPIIVFNSYTELQGSVSKLLNINSKI
jgi:energy-coupling factor transporter ATP-binding protein EcfA2